MSCPKLVVVAALVKTASLSDILALSNPAVCSDVTNLAIFALFSVCSSFSEYFELNLIPSNSESSSTLAPSSK